MCGCGFRCNLNRHLLPGTVANREGFHHTPIRAHTQTHTWNVFILSFLSWKAQLSVSTFIILWQNFPKGISLQQVEMQFITSTQALFRLNHRGFVFHQSLWKKISLMTHGLTWCWGVFLNVDGNIFKVILKEMSFDQSL